MEPVGPIGPPDFAVRKQLNYEASRVKDLLHAFCGGRNENPFQVMVLVREAGGQPTTAWFNERFAGCPVAVEAAKLKAPVSLATLMSPHPDRAEFLRAYAEARCNHATARQVAMVFDHHGDKVTDMAVHNVSSFADEGRATLTLRPAWPADGELLWVCRWADFVDSLARRYHPFL